MLEKKHYKGTANTHTKARLTEVLTRRAGKNNKKKGVQESSKAVDNSGLKVSFGFMLNV